MKEIQELKNTLLIMELFINLTLFEDIITNDGLFSN